MDSIHQNGIDVLLPVMMILGMTEVDVQLSPFSTTMWAMKAWWNAVEVSLFTKWSLRTPGRQHCCFSTCLLPFNGEM